MDRVRAGRNHAHMGADFSGKMRIMCTIFRLGRQQPSRGDGCAGACRDKLSALRAPAQRRRRPDRRVGDAVGVHPVDPLDRCRYEQSMPPRRPPVLRRGHATPAPASHRAGSADRNRALLRGRPCCTAHSSSARDTRTRCSSPASLEGSGAARFGRPAGVATAWTVPPNPAGSESSRPEAERARPRSPRASVRVPAPPGSGFLRENSGRKEGRWRRSTCQ